MSIDYGEEINFALAFISSPNVNGGYKEIVRDELNLARNADSLCNTKIHLRNISYYILEHQTMKMNWRVFSEVGYA